LRYPFIARVLLVAAVAAGILVPRPAAVGAAVTAQTDENVVVQITSPRPGERLRGPVEITGYALDRRSSDGAGLNERDVQIFLTDSAPRNLFTYGETGRDSPQAATDFGPQFRRAGFRADWHTCAFAPGPYRLVVWVSSVATPGARNSASLDVELEPCAPGQVVYTDDFAARPGGVSRLIREERGWTSSGLAPTGIFADAAMGIDARCVQAEQGCTSGLTFRRLPGPAGPASDSLYRFGVDPVAGTVGLEYYPPGEAAERLVWLLSPTPSAAIRPGTATNRLGVIAQGESLRLFVNGEQVGEVQHADRPWGRFAWSLGQTSPEGTVVAEYDNLVISTPGPLELLGLALRGQ
jgi:hypothetical protein